MEEHTNYQKQIRSIYEQLQKRQRLKIEENNHLVMNLQNQELFLLKHRI